jgi:RNA polymerase sigma-70 factor, ECF subfamily
MPVEQHAIAFQALVSSKLPMFRRMAYRQLGNVSDAEDAVQDALLLAHRNLSQFRGDSSLSSWIGRIVVNSALMQRRRGGSRLRMMCCPVEDVVSDLRDSKPSSEELVSANAEWRRVADAISKLTPALREPLLLWLDGNPIKEIAAVLNCPVGSVKASISRAKAKLRDRVGAKR